MDNKNVMILVVAFMSLIVGVGLLGVVAQEGLAKTTTLYVANETIDIANARDDAGGNATLNQTIQFTITNAPTGWKITECPISNFDLRNQSGQTMTVNIDYYFTANSGLLNLTNVEILNSTSSNTTAVNYNYCGDDYIVSAWQRTVLNLVPGFFALALLGISLGLFYVVLKNEGLLGI